MGLHTVKPTTERERGRERERLKNKEYFYDTVILKNLHLLTFF